MNLLVLLAGLLPWAASPADALFRIYAAVGLLSLEMQVVTLTGTGSLYVLPFVNVPLAVGLALWQGTIRMPRPGWVAEVWRAAPPLAIVALAAGVLALNLLRPLEAADPYHLERMAQIQRFGTLEYDPAAVPKVNIVGWVYELVLADVSAMPLVGAALVRIHGVVNLALLLVALAAAREWLQRDRADDVRRGAEGAQWPWTVFLVVPVAFHLLVLVKNDLFLAVPAFAAFVWLVARAPEASVEETARAGALVGFVVGAKLTNLPLAILLAAGVVLARRDATRRLLTALAVGGVIGAAAGGLFFTLYENARWYGDAFASGPVAEMGNTTSGPISAVQSVLRFAVSLVDVGQVTPRVWPGRGGWGSTFGLPFIWAAAVLVAHLGAERSARWIAAIAAAHFLAFAAVFPDADLAQRLVLSSGLLVIAGAIVIVQRGGRHARAARLALVPVLILSAAQLVRSAVLYLGR